MLMIADHSTAAKCSVLQIKSAIFAKSHFTIDEQKWL